MDDGIDPAPRDPPSRAEGGERKAFLLRLGDRLRATADAAEAKAVAAEMLGRHLDVARAGYAEIEHEGEWFQVETDWSRKVRSLAGEVKLLDAYGPALAKDLRAARIVRVDDIATDPRANGARVSRLWAGVQVRALIAVPLVRSRRLVAFLYLHDPYPRAWTDSEAELAQDVADRTWDAVERARAEAELRANDARLHDLADALPVLIAYIDAERHFRFANKPYISWFHRPRDEIVGRHVREVLGDAMYDVGSPYLERALSGERVVYEAEFAGNPRRHTVNQHIPHFSPDGRVLGLFSLVQDATEHKRIEAELRQSRDEFAAVLDAVPAAILIADDPDCSVIRANCRGAQMLGMSAGANVSMTGQPELSAHFRFFDGDGCELAPEELPVQRAARGDPSFMHEVRVVFDDGSATDLLGNAVPLYGANGEIRGAIGAFIDIGGRRRAEDALREERTTLEILNRIGTALVAELDLDRLVQLVTDAGVAVTGARSGAFVHQLSDTEGESMMLHTLPGAGHQYQCALQDVVAALEPAFRGRSLVRSDDLATDPRCVGIPSDRCRKGQAPVRSYLAVPVLSRNGRTIGSLLFGHPEPGRFNERHERLVAGIAAQAGVAIDNASLYQKAQQEIEQRKLAEDHQRLLIGELNHRVKNSLAIVQGVAQQTLRDGMDMAEARRAFEGRLAALSSAHEVLTRRNWEHARFSEIVEGALAPFHRPHDDRMVVRGEDIRIQPKTAVSLAMAFHELATNAVKYGAWSNETGRVVVEWQVIEIEEGARLHLIWREEGGPPVIAPERRRFGSRMVERALAAELDGSVRLVFDPAGLRCEIDTPLPQQARIQGPAPKGEPA